MQMPHAKGSFVTYRAGWNMGPHAHAAFELSAVLEGSGTFLCGAGSYPLQAGHIVLIPSGVSHDYRSDAPIRFGVLEAGGMPDRINRLMARLAPDRTPRLLALSPIALSQYEDLYRQWLRMISQPLMEEAACLAAWVELLLLFLLQHQGSRGMSLSVASAADYIRASLDKELSIGELAKACRLSESAFRSAFKQAFGLSPKQYQQQCRIEEARWLLRSTGKSVQTIGSLIGFASIHAFSGWFQKKEGASPTDWRKSQQGMNGTAAKIIETQSASSPY